MKKQLTFCFFLLLATSGVVSPGPVAAASAFAGQAAPSQAYFLLADEIATLFQQLEKLPTAQSSALLRQKAPSLLARIKQVRPAYRHYLQSLSAQQLQLENERVAASHWANYFATWETAGLDAKPKLKTLMQPGSPSGQTILGLMSIFERV